jgi:hypothetical protein
VICSVLIIGGCIFVGSGALASFAQTWDCCALAFGVIIFPPTVCMALAQYAGTFRRHKSAAYAIGLGLMILSGFMLFVAVVTAGGFIAKGERDPMLLAAFVGPMLFICGFGFYAGRLNLLWSRTLERNYQTPEPFYRLSLRELFGWITVLGLSMGLVSYFVRTTPPQFAEHLETDDPPFNIPDGATDISFCQGGRGALVYEFTIDEEGFLKWVEDSVIVKGRIGNEPKLEPIQGQCTIRSYQDLMPGANPSEYIVVVDGWVYASNNSGGWTKAVYDRTNRRAYYESFSD